MFRNRKLTSQYPRPFSLLQLPSEVWIKFGQMAVDAEPMVIRICGSYMGSACEDRVCKLLRPELLPYFYGSHITFRVSMPNHDANERAEMGLGLCAIGNSNRWALQSVLLTKQVAKYTHVLTLLDAWDVDFILSNRGSHLITR